MNAHGNCLCGKTEVKVKQLKKTVIACHCNMCRKQAAGPIFYSDAKKPQSYEFLDSSTVQIYNSSDWAERAFCSNCGTFLFTRYKKNGDTHFNIELFDEQKNEADFKLQIHVGDKANYYEFANETRKIN